MDLKEKIVVKSIPFYKHVSRFVTYTGITEDHVMLALKKMHYVLEEIANEQTDIVKAKG